MISLSSQTTAFPFSPGCDAGRFAILKHCGGTSLLACTLLAAAFLALLPGAHAQVTANFTTLPNNISVTSGALLPLGATVINTDATRVITQVQFAFNGADLLSFPVQGPYTTVITAPLAPGSYGLTLRVSDASIADSADIHVTTVDRTVTVVPVDANDPTPTARLLTDLNGRTILGGTSILLTAIDESLRPDGGLLARVDFFCR